MSNIQFSPKEGAICMPLITDPTGERLNNNTAHEDVKGTPYVSHAHS